MRAASETAVAPHKDDRRLLIAAAALTVAIFALDAYLPLGVAISAIYGVVIQLGLIISLPSFPLWTAGVATLLTAVGGWISPPGGRVLYAVVNRGLTLAGMWITAWLITKYGKVGRALHRSVKDLADMKFALDQASIVATTDVRGKITYANDRFVEISKYPRERLIGQDHRLINSGYHSKEFIRDLWQTIGQGRIWRGEIRNRASDGSHYWVDTTIVPFLDDRRKPYQYMAIRYDITDRKQSEARLREQAALARLGEMAAVVAHEVKNPIAGIRGALQVIGGRMPETSLDKGIIGEIVARLDSLNEIVQDLLVFARPREPQLSPVPLGTLIAETVAHFRRDPAQQALIVEVTGESPVVQADAGQLRTVFLNLLLNASHAQASTGTVRVNTAVRGGEAVVSIADQGVGVPADIRDKIFEPFFTTKNRGTGLGLPTARRVVERHGGAVELDSPAAGGTIVTVRLPLG
jgi:two-component system CheB/CheR fusion protein